MKRIMTTLALCVALFMAQEASAHFFWINLTESHTHPPGHVTTQLGFGHNLPVDDLLVGPHGAINIEKYLLVSPDKKVFDLGKVDVTPTPEKKTPSEMIVNEGDLGLRKISITSKSTPGTYQVVAQSTPAFITKYRNSKGKVKIAPMTMDKVKDAKDVVFSVRFQAFSKAFFDVQKWTTPEPMGHLLEIMPLTGMTDIHAGDMIRFRVTFKGKPVTVSSGDIAFMQFLSNSFGGPDTYFVGAFIADGIVNVRIPVAGQWFGNVMVSEKIADNPALKGYQDKCTMLFTSASVGFTVKP